VRAIACLNFNDDMSWGYIEGYRRAANLLADRMIVENQDLDFLIYPMGFMYRHHFELQLKYLIQKIGILNEQLESPAPMHLLQHLWANLRPKLLELQLESDAFCVEIDQGIDLVVQLDESSQEFRYAMTKAKKQVKPSLEGQKHIDVEDFHESCERLAESLQAIHDWVNVEVDSKLEHDYAVAQLDLEV